VPADLAGGELAAVIGAEREQTGLDAAGQDGGLDAGDRLVAAG
jgi:hypothetical protein